MSVGTMRRESSGGAGWLSCGTKRESAGIGVSYATTDPSASRTQKKKDVIN